MLGIIKHVSMSDFAIQELKNKRTDQIAYYGKGEMNENKKFNK